MNYRELSELALALIVSDGEWCVESTSSDFHYVTCRTCGASHANVALGSPALRHQGDCDRERLFKAVRAL